MIRLIACLDIDGDRVVKTGKGEELRDAGDPVELGKFYCDEGADELAFLDITASGEDAPTILAIASRLAGQLAVPFALGGGIRSMDDIRGALQAGASKVCLNTAAILHPELIREAAAEVDSSRIVVAIDVRRRTPTAVEKMPEPAHDLPVGLAEGLSRGEMMLGLESLGGLVGIEESPSFDDTEVPAEDEPPSWEVYRHGGRVPTGIDALEWAAKVAEFGAGEIWLTSLDSDGYDLELIQAVAGVVHIPVIASGGAGRPEHLIAAVAEGQAAGVLLASILHDGVYRIADLKQQMADAGLPVRLTG